MDAHNTNSREKRARTIQTPRRQGRGEWTRDDGAYIEFYSDEVADKLLHCTVRA